MLAQIPSLTDLAGIALVVIGVAIHKPAPQPRGRGRAYLLGMQSRPILSCLDRSPDRNHAVRAFPLIGSVSGSANAAISRTIRWVVEIAGPDDVALLSRRVASGHPKIG